MSFFYLYNPKCFVDPWIKSKGFDPYKRKREEPDKFEELEEPKEPEETKIVGSIASEALSEIPQVKTRELDSKLSSFIGFSQKIAQIEQKLENLSLELAEKQKIMLESQELEKKRQEIAREILLMDGEEKLLALLLLDD